MGISLYKTKHFLASEAIKRDANIRKEYEELYNNFCEINNKKTGFEEQCKKKALHEIAKDYYYSKVNYLMKINCGLSEKFNIRNYPQEMVNYLFEFIIMDVFDSEVPLIQREKKKGELQPNKKIVSNMKNGHLGYNYERYYEYCIKYGNKYMRRNVLVGTIQEARELDFDDYNKHLNKIFMKIENKKKYFYRVGRESYWKNSFYYIDNFFSQVMSKVMVAILKEEHISYFRLYMASDRMKVAIQRILYRIMELGALDCEDEVDKIKIIYEEAVEYAKSRLLGKDYSFIQNYLIQDVFQDYAMSCFIGIEERRCKFDICLWDALKLEINEKQEKTVFERIKDVRGESDEKIVKELLYSEGNEKYEKKRMYSWMKKLLAAGKAMNTYYGGEYNLNELAALEALRETIYKKREIEFDFEGNRKKYNMYKILNKIKDEKRQDNDYWEDSLVFLHRFDTHRMYLNVGKIKTLRRIDLEKALNHLQEKIYEQESDCTFFLMLPFYWLEVLHYISNKAMEEI